LSAAMNISCRFGPVSKDTGLHRRLALKRLRTLDHCSAAFA
jgi:hypothetical protein